MFRFLILSVFILFNLESYSQILPGMYGAATKKGSGAVGGAVTGTRNFTNCGKGGSEGPSQSDCNTAYASNDLNGEVTVTSGIQYWTVPTTGTYTITAIGATAGNDGETSVYVGRPAKIIGDFSLTQGDVIKILVGQHGWKASCRPGWGGGGGTFVTKNDNTILLIAGGCGSSHTNISNVHSWQDANTGESGNFQSGDTHAAGTNGSGGGALSHPYAGAGGGSKNNGSNQTNTLNDIGTNKAELDGSVVISW